MSPKPQSRVELLQGTLDLLILRTLLAGPTHGHAIAKHIQRTSEELLQVETGSLYPALHRREGKDAELHEELQFHLAEEAAERQENGLSEAVARYADQRDLGNLTQVME